MKIDSDLLDWFKRDGPGYQRRMNDALRRVVEAEKREAALLARARELFGVYFDRCFWDMKEDAEITPEQVPVIVERLRKYGGREGFRDAATLRA